MSTVLDTPGMGAYIDEIVAAAPPLSEETIDELRLIFGTGGVRPAPRLDRTPAVVSPERTALYRHFDSDGRLLYVGISKDPNSRRRQHRRASAWVEFAQTETVEWFGSRDEAKDAESAAIRDEGPLFNYSEAGSDRDRNLVEYIIAREAYHLLSPVASSAR